MEAEMKTTALLCSAAVLVAGCAQNGPVDPRAFAAMPAAPYASEPHAEPPVDPQQTMTYEQRHDDLLNRVERQDFEHWYEFFRAHGYAEDEAAHKAWQRAR
jgi:hypothetical protein